MLILTCFVATPVAGQVPTEATSQTVESGGTGRRSREASLSRGSQVVVSCPELSDEQLAAVEARHLSALTLDGQPGTLELACIEREVVGTWREDGREPDTRSISRKAGEDPTELLHWVASLLLETRGVAVTATGTANTTADATAHPQEPEGSGAAPRDPEREEMATSTSSQPATAAEAGASTAEGAPNQGLAARTSPWHWGLGLEAELWLSEIPVLLGPRLTVSWLPTSFGVRGAVSQMFGTKTPAGLSATDSGVELLAVFSPISWWAIQGGPVLSVLALLPPAGTNEGATFSVAAGGEVLGGLRLGGSRAALSIDGGVKVFGARRETTLDGVRVLQVPEVQGVFALGADF